MRFRSADSMRREVKSAHFSRSSAIVQNADRPDLALLPHDRVHHRRVVHAAVEDQAHGVVPATPGRQPVGEQQPSGLDLQAELLLDLAGDRELRRLAHLDHAARQVEVALVGELAEQHPVVGRPDQHLADRPLAREEGVQQRPEPLRVLERGVVDEPRVDDPVGLLGDAARDALAHQPGERRHPLGGLVVGVDVGLDPGGAALEGRLDQPAHLVRGDAQPLVLQLGGPRNAHHTGGNRGQLGSHALTLTTPRALPRPRPGVRRAAPPGRSGPSRSPAPGSGRRAARAGWPASPRRAASGRR